MQTGEMKEEIHPKEEKKREREPLIENGGGVETHKRKTGIYFIAGNLFI